MNRYWGKATNIPWKLVLLLCLTPRTGRLHTWVIFKVDRRIIQRCSHEWRIGLLENLWSVINTSTRSRRRQETHFLTPNWVVTLASAWVVERPNPVRCLGPWQGMGGSVVRVWIRFVSDGVSRLNLSHARGALPAGPAGCAVEMFPECEREWDRRSPKEAEEER